MGKVPSALKISIDFERRGVGLYMQLAAKTKNPLTRRLFYQLAQQEIQHIILFEEVYEKLKRENKWPRWTVEEGEKLEYIVKEYFQAVKKDPAVHLTDNVKGLEMAMQIEKKGFVMYEKFLAKATDNNEKLFYKELLKQENAHYEALANMHLYLTQTSDWFSEEESHVWNWMNL
jgi:rubrerythrin